MTATSRTESLRTTVSLTPVRTFVEVARFLSFSRAAESLAITQSAVSKQVQALEQQLGAPLFLRHGRGLALTQAAHAYLPHAHDALARLEEGCLAARMAMGEAQADPPLEVSVAPSFAAHWLVPRLRRYLGGPDRFARINIRPRLPDQRRTDEVFDLEVRLGAGRWPGAQSAYLLGREMAVVVSPDLLRGRHLRAPEELAGLPLIARAQRGYDWVEWCAAMAPGWRPQPGLVFEGFSVLVPAVVAGLGAAICPLFMIAKELERGTLVRPLGECVRARHGFYTVVRGGTVRNAARDRFQAWLQAEARLASQHLNALVEGTHSGLE